MKNSKRIQTLTLLAAIGLTSACAAEMVTSKEEAADNTASSGPVERQGVVTGGDSDDFAERERSVVREDSRSEVVADRAPAADAPAQPPVTPKAASRKDMKAKESLAKKPVRSSPKKTMASLDKNVDGLMVAEDLGGVASGAVAPPREPMRKADPKPQPEPVAVMDPSRSNNNAEQYTDHGVNPMTSTSEDRFSTFSVDVDTGSYTVTRRKLNEGVNVPAASVRVEEFVNYFGYDYPTPDSGAFGVHLEAAPSPFDPAPDRLLLRVGVQGKTVTDADRKPVHLTFLVDVSGSMNRPDKLGLAKSSLKILTDRLGPKDSVALVTYAGSNRLVLADTPATEGNKAKIKKAIDDLRSGGGTAMSSGMELAYKQAIATTKPGHVSRVLVMSDGDANIGPSSHSQILNQIKAYVDEGVTLSTIGFGMGNYKDTLMEQLSNKGNGNYYYIDSVDEARKVFGEQADGTLEVIAKDVKLQVEFNPEAVASYRLVGYENRDIADEDFRNDAVDAGEIGAGHTVTAFYEVVLTGKKASDLGYVRIRAKKPDGYQAAEQIFTWRSVAVKTKLSDASRDFQFGAAVAAFAEKLRKSPYAEGLTWGLIEEVAKASAGDKKDRNEFLGLVKKAKAQHKG